MYYRKKKIKRDYYKKVRYEIMSIYLHCKLKVDMYYRKEKFFKRDYYDDPDEMYEINLGNSL